MHVLARHVYLRCLARPRSYLCMPQLTLFGSGPGKSLALSPEKASSSSASGSGGRRNSSTSNTSPTSRRSASTTARILSYTRQGDEPNLWELHHIQEDMVAARRAAAARSAKEKKNGGGDERESGKQAVIEEQDPKDIDVDEGKKARQVEKGAKKGKKLQEDGEKGEDGHMNEDEERPKGQPKQPAGKRDRSPEGGGVAGREAKRQKNAYEIKGKVATAEDAARVDEDPPIDQLNKLMEPDSRIEPEKGDSVVYWMRMEDLRLEDNTALHLASECAKKLGVPLIWVFVFSPGDYKWHDRSPRRIDFMLRNLQWLQPKFDELNIPLYTFSHPQRLAIPRKLVTEVFPSLGANRVFANIEYEVDELRRDIATVKVGREKGIEVTCVHDRLVVPPGKIKSQKGTPLAVFSPWQRQWAALLDREPKLLKVSPAPAANDASVRKHKTFAKLFDTEVPESIAGSECKDRDQMKESWPEGLDNAQELLQRFLHTKARKSQLKLVSPLSEGAEEDTKHSRINAYATGRNLVDGDNSSRLSPYLASGVISGRMVLQEAKKMNSKGKLESGRDTGVGMWVQEVSWRDFYSHILCTWPRVSMGRPFLEKFADVQWEVSEEHLQAWKDGKTGYPIVDAAMRACAKRGWMENRLRMVTASFLVKSLMLDWRLGEKYFMESFIDGDLAANNGGWQWTASTGTDPQPYFRIFNTITQSEKCDPDGDYIRYWVPELKHLKGKVIHDPFHHMPKGEFAKLGYPEPIVDHKASRERALFRYKNVGEKE